MACNSRVRTKLLLGWEDLRKFRFGSTLTNSDVCHDLIVEKKPINILKVN